MRTFCPDSAEYILYMCLRYRLRSYFVCDSSVRDRHSITKSRSHSRRRGTIAARLYAERYVATDEPAAVNALLAVHKTASCTAICAVVCDAKWTLCPDCSSSISCLHADTPRSNLCAEVCKSCMLTMNFVN
jgi:hypothetical protein